MSWDRPRDGILVETPHPVRRTVRSGRRSAILQPALGGAPPHDLGTDDSDFTDVRAPYARREGRQRDSSHRPRGRPGRVDAAFSMVAHMTNRSLDPVKTEERAPGAGTSARPRPIEHACFWLAERRRPADPPLLGRREADIVIIGAGLTGLWTANFLKTLDPSREIVVLEQGIAAYGASGRNAGMLGEGIDHSHELAIAHFGRREAARMARLGIENLAGLLKFLEERKIDCDLERTGHLHVALLPSQVEELRHAKEASRQLGLDHYELLDAGATRAELNCSRYQGGLYNPRGCVLNPVKLVEGLKREAARAGIVFHERTRVTSIERSNGGVRLRTAHLPGAAGTESRMEATGVAADRLQAAASRLRAAAARAQA